MKQGGTSLADVTNPATAQTALNNAGGDGGRFDVPGIPGASGYATAYHHDYFGTPRILLVGFDLDRSHLVDEGSPPTHRCGQGCGGSRSLRHQAGNYFLKHRETGDLAAAAKDRVAFRDPNGPWRHGPVYLADPESRTIWVSRSVRAPTGRHFPRRRDRRLVADQLIAAATAARKAASGCITSTIDDDTDSTDIPKVGYARCSPATSRCRVAAQGQFGSEPRQRVCPAYPGSTAKGKPRSGMAEDGDARGMRWPFRYVHFAYRPAGSSEAFTYLGAATNREGVASFAWDTLEDGLRACRRKTKAIAYDNRGKRRQRRRRWRWMHRGRACGPHAHRSCRTPAGLPDVWTAAPDGQATLG